jgi:predicted ATPase
MIESIQFQNFKVLRDATLKLRPFNVIIGPNGSGKSTAFQALEAVKNANAYEGRRLITAGVVSDTVSVKLHLPSNAGKLEFATSWTTQGSIVRATRVNQSPPHPNQAQILANEVNAVIHAIRVFALEANKIASFAPLNPNTQLAKDGANLVAALDNLRDANEEVFNSLKEELRTLLPEFDNIIFETPAPNMRTFKLRQRIGKHAIPSSDLSEGTLIALALLLIAHNPNPPALVCLEEPDRGLHPRLLRDIRDALYRLSYPEQFGLKRKPVQVIATTHSPYFLDLFKDHPEEIIVAEKHADGTAGFKSLADDPELQQVIGNAPLGEVWYSGLLGGVPVLK